MPLEFRLLGPLEVWDNGREVDLGSGRQRALLALLVVHAEPVSAERLADELWDGKPPASAQKIIQGYVSQLRRALPDGTISTRGSAYELDDAETDAAAFARLVDRAGGEDPTTALKTLRRALGLWRGRPLSEFEYESWAQTEASRLDELRLVAIEERIDAELALGESARLVPELEALAAEHPLRERLHCHLMAALYRSGRQADALEVYTALRRRLDELGLEPAPELQDLQRRVLTQDPALGAPARARPIVTRRRGKLLIALGGLLVAGAVTATAFELAGTSHAAVAGDALALVNSALKVDTQALFNAPQSSIAVGDGVVWTLNGVAGTITSIDEHTHKILDTFSAGQRPIDVVYGDGSFWVLNGGYQPPPDLKGHAINPSVARYDPTSHQLLGTIPLPPPPAGAGFFYLGHRPGERELAFGGGSVWVLNARSIDGSVYRIDPNSGHIVKHLTGFYGASIAFAEGHLWVANVNSDPGEVDELDPAGGKHGKIVRRVRTPGTVLSSLAVGAGAVWAPDFYTGTTWRIIPGPFPVVHPIATHVGVTSVVISNGFVWVGNEIDDTLTKIDAKTGAIVATIRIPAPQALVATGQGPLVASGPASGEQSLPGPACGPLQYTGSGAPRFIVASDFDFRADPTFNSALASAVLTVLQRRHYRAGPYSIGYQSCDDSSGVSGVFDPGTCAANASLYAKTPKVIGVVGTYDSGCAGEEIPVLETAHGGPVALISPSNTADILTRVTPGEPPDALQHFYPTGVRNYFRVVGPDAIAVAADATLAKQLGMKRVAVIDTREGGVNLSHIAWFRYAARQLGMTTVVVPWTPATKLRAGIAGLRGLGVDGVFIPEDPPVPPAKFAAFVHGVGGPVIFSDFFTPVPRGLPPGIYVGIWGLPNNLLPPAGQGFLHSLAQPGPSLSSAYAAEAATVLLDAIAASDGSRADVVRLLHRTNVHDGLVGNLRFTAGGDPVTAPVTILRGVRRGGIDNDFYGSAVVDRIISPAPATIHP